MRWPAGVWPSLLRRVPRPLDLHTECRVARGGLHQPMHVVPAGINFVFDCILQHSQDVHVGEGGAIAGQQHHHQTGFRAVTRRFASGAGVSRRFCSAFGGSKPNRTPCPSHHCQRHGAPRVRGRLLQTLVKSSHLSTHAGRAHEHRELRATRPGLHSRGSRAPASTPCLGPSPRGGRCKI